ncbi:tetratricopeptide repeat protein [Dokdonella koreensis]|uniref:Uncharacterized protein n=1 Tax=Dokdonella koreensis DS-123 TaxID=1300342 RepID=A0A160DRX1_9GAMM|nr:tetratricopeptide repeat protein [Dokdonella koreensis]ANB16977.1 Hypothetical protein I596_947 [Dokdonella koreensis DS-123]
MQSDDQIVFDSARRFMQRGDFDAALRPLEALLAVHPEATALRWHRSRCLEKLGRRAEAIAELDQVIQRRSDYLPALLARMDLGDGDEAVPEDAGLFRRILALEPGHPRASYRLARALADDADAALPLLDRALAADPSQHDAWRLRADLRYRAAAQPGDAVPAATLVRDPLGIAYDRTLLEAALADYESAAAIEEDTRTDLRIAEIAQRLDRPAEALERYDAALRRLAGDDPARAHVQALRDRAEGGSAGEREHYARMIEASLGAANADRSLREDWADAAMRSAADQIRKGADVPAALETFVSDSPDDMTVTYIARQIYNLAHEPPPGLEPAVPADFPAYQGRHADTVARAIEPLGYLPLADAEAKNLTVTLGQRVLIRLFTHPQFGAAAAFAMRPKWPGLLGYLVMLLSGKWRIQRMLECSARISDGCFLSTREAGPDPFDYGGAEHFRFETLPRGSGPAAVARRHAERVEDYLAAHPDCHVDVPASLDGVEGQWIESNQIKAEHRRSLDYVTDAELRGVLGKHYDRYAGKVRARLALMTAE